MNYYENLFDDLVEIIDRSHLEDDRATKALRGLYRLVEKEKAQSVDYSTIQRNFQGEKEYLEPHCPGCNHLFWSNEMYGYCPKCGQKLDWSGEDDTR